MINVKINKDFKFLYTPELKKYREVIFYGGRGGAKTYEMVQFFCLKAMTEKANFLCLREYARTNANSTLQEFILYIQNHNLEVMIKETNERFKNNKRDKAINIKKTIIEFNHTGSRIIFTGINDNTAMSVKSIAHIKYAWIDEAVFLTEYSHHIFKPTIRENDACIFYTYNPQNRDDYIYQYTQNAINRDDIKTFKVNFNTNAFLPNVLKRDVLNDFKYLPRWKFNHIWLGEPADYNELAIIDTSKIGYYTNDEKYTEIIIACDTASSSKENADYSVIAVAGLTENRNIHMLRLYRGKWLYNALVDKLKGAYDVIKEIYKQAPSCVLIENKSSGISLVQEMQYFTRLPILPITPKKDKVTRVEVVLSEFSRLYLPSEKTPINAWVDAYLQELKDFRGDMEHKHDDQVDATVYILEYFKNNVKIDWSKFNNLNNYIF